MSHDPSRGLILPLPELVVGCLLPALDAFIPSDPHAWVLTRVRLRRASRAHASIDAEFMPPPALLAGYEVYHGSRAGRLLASAFHAFACAGWQRFPYGWHTVFSSIDLICFRSADVMQNGDLRYRDQQTLSLKLCESRHHSTYRTIPRSILIEWIFFEENPTPHIETYPTPEIADSYRFVSLMHLSACIRANSPELWKVVTTVHPTMPFYEADYELAIPEADFRTAIAPYCYPRDQ